MFPICPPILISNNNLEYQFAGATFVRAVAEDAFPVAVTLPFLENATTEEEYILPVPVPPAAGMVNSIIPMLLPWGLWA